MLCLVHGATFLALRTDGAVRQRARGFARRAVWLALALVVVWAVWTVTISDGGPWRIAAACVSPVAAAVAVLLLREQRDGRSFAAGRRHDRWRGRSALREPLPHRHGVLDQRRERPDGLRGRLGDYALKVMTVVALVMLPVVLLYQGWSYWVFRRRVTLPTAGAHAS